MVNSKDTKVIEELILLALLQASHSETYIHTVEDLDKVKRVVKNAFDIIIDEMKSGGI